MENKLNILGKAVTYVQPHLSRFVLAAFSLGMLFLSATRMFAASADGCAPSFVRLETLDQQEKQILTSALDATLVRLTRDTKSLGNYSILDIYGTNDWAIMDIVFGPTEDTDAIFMFPSEKLNDGWHVHSPGSSDAMRILAQIPAPYNPLTGFDRNDWRFTSPAFLDQQQMLAARQALSATIQYRLPYANGTTVIITQDSVAHGGPIDMVGQSGKTIVAAADGTIEDIVQSHNECCCSSVCDPCINYIVMQHANNEWTKYLHIAQNSAQVTIGQYVTAGTVLATEGDVGRTCSSGSGSRPPVPCNGSSGGTQNCARHLHFELRLGGRFGTFENPNFCNVGYVTTGQTKTASACNSPQTGLIKTPNDQTVYWLQNNKIYGVVSGDVVTTMQNAGMPGWNWSSITTVSSLSAYTNPGILFIEPTARSVGLLVKLSSNSAVYRIVNGGYKEYLTESEFLSRGYSFNDVVDIPQVYLDMFPTLGSLQVTLSPAAAVSAGAQWQVDGGTYQNSGTTVSNLSIGSHTVAFKSISGWTTPNNQTVTVNVNQTITATGTYVAIPQNGSLQVTLLPAGAVSAGAQWQVDGGAFQNSGATVSNLSPGSHTVAFKSISGWTTPNNQTVTVNANQTTTTTGIYVVIPQEGALQVTLSPTGAVNAGAQWQVDGGAFQNSGATVSNLSPGSHTVAFKSISGWTTPNNQTVTVNANQTITATGIYVAIPQEGSLQVTLSPAGAVSAGAQWQVDGGAFQSSGTTVNLSLGSHTVAFKSISGWATPNSQSVNIQAGEVTSITAAYNASPTYLLTVNASGISSVVISSTTGHDGTTNYTKAVASGTQVQLSAPATSGSKTFSGWTGAVTNSSQTISFSMTEEKTVAANYVDGGVMASHSTLGFYAGGTCTVNCTITYNITPGSLGWEATIPGGWSYASDTSGANVKPNSGDTQTVGWAWFDPLPASPVQFSYTLSVPVGETTDKPISATMGIDAQQYSAQPHPLTCSPILYHSADSGRDWKISLFELLRVIQHFNYRAGTVRTGEYHMDGTAADGYAPGPGTQTGRYHSADYGRDWKISLFELLRIIQHFNHRAGTIRTGEYRLDSTTVDGYAPGPSAGRSGGARAALTANHSTTTPHYAPGATVTVNCQITYQGTPSSLGWEAAIPFGWSYVTSSSGADITPNSGDTQTLGWAWYSRIPPSPVTFSFTLSVPANASGPASISSIAGADTELVNATPNPLIIGSLDLSVILTTNKTSLAENGSGNPATITATLSAAHTETVTVEIGSSGSATNIDDYTRSGTSITIPAGQTVGNVTINAVQDSIDEIDETVVIDVTAVTNAAEQGTQQVTITILDDDIETEPPDVTLLSPADDATGVSTETNLEIIFDEAVQKGAGDVVIRHTDNGTEFERIAVASDQVAIAGSLVIVDLQGKLAYLIGYYVEVSAGAFTDLAGNPYAGLFGSGAWNFTTAACPGLFADVRAGHWTMDEASGTTVTDNSGNGNNGVAANGPTIITSATNPPAKFGNARLFDGVNDFIEVTNGPSLNFTTQLALAAWVRPTAEKLAMIVNNEGRYQIAFREGTFQFAVANSSPGWGWVNTNSRLPLNTWTHIALTYDAGAASNQFRAYVNGIQVFANAGSGSISDAMPSLNQFRIGGRSFNNSEFFAGGIDDVQVFNRALSDAEIETVFENALLSFTHLPPDITISCTAIADPANPDPAVTGAPTASTTDPCALFDPPTVSYVDSPSASVCPRIITRTWTADDGANTLTGVQTITITDTTTPAIVNPADITVQCHQTSPGTAENPSILGYATATDCNTVTIAWSDAVSDVFPACPNAYTITRTWTATDICGNASTANQLVAVQDTVDPVFADFPANVVIECDDSINANAAVSTAVAGQPTATDNCSAAVTILFDDDIDPPYVCPATITRTWTADDDCGNTVTMNQMLSIKEDLITATPIRQFQVTVEAKIDGRHSQYRVGSDLGYAIDGHQGKALYLLRGRTYTFHVNNTTTHSFYISTSAVGGGAGVVTNGVGGGGNFIENGTLEFTPDVSTPDLLYYQCGHHPNMGWKMYILDAPAAQLITTEDGDSSMFNVALGKAPSDNVTVTVTSNDASEGTVDDTTLTFTPGNWNVAQPIVIRGANDNQRDGSQAYTITVSAASADMAFGGLTEELALLNLDRTGLVQFQSIDIDGNGRVEALTDGMLLLRYTFGFRGAAVVEGAIGDGCVRCDAPAIEAYLGAMMP